MLADYVFGVIFSCLNYNIIVLKFCFRPSVKATKPLFTALTGERKSV